MLKIVYFDEGSAIDYLDIANGGKVSSTKEKKKKKSTSGKAEIEANIKQGVIFKALAPFVKSEISINAGGGINALSESLVKTTISNSVLSEYLKEADEDDSVKKINNCSLEAYNNSISYIKMYTPYTKMLKMDNDDIDITMMDDVLLNSKGYYELLLKSDEGKVVRFNIEAFRNNYNLMDLTKMHLKLYLIKVGEIDLSSLDLEKELSFDVNKQTLSGEDILKGTNDSTISKAGLFDVVLAGIE